MILQYHEVIAHFDRAIATLTKEICVRAKHPNSKALIEKRAARAAIEKLKAEIACVQGVTESLEPVDNMTLSIARRFAPD